jgi:O-antigen biosynthesis protein
MIQRLKNTNAERLIKKYYRKIYWKFFHRFNGLVYKFLCQFLNSEIPFSEDLHYYQWLVKNYSRKADLQSMAEAVKLFAYKPLISIIVPVYNTPENFLREMLDSVLFQVYPHWEICICDDASPAKHVMEVLNEYTTKDSRIKVVRNTKNKHISHTSNSAIEIASGEFISLLDHDDLLTPDALYEVVSLLNQHPEADMIYSDEDKILPDKSLTEAFFKQDWCPDSFLTHMYICHLGTYRLSIVKDIGGFKPGYEGSQDYDLVLRFTEKTDKIFHIPKILYHWRIHPESTSGGMEAKSYATSAAQLAISDAIFRRGECGTVTPIPLLPGHYRVRYNITEYKLVSIIISASSGVDLDRCLSSVFARSSYDNYEAIIVDNGRKDLDFIQTVNRWIKKEPDRCKCYSLDVPLDYPELNNYLVSKATGSYILFLNSSLEVITPDWIEALVEQVQRSSIGAAGALLLNSDETIDHAGIIISHEGSVEYSYRGSSSTDIGYFGCVGLASNYSAVSINCLICKREVFDSVGGFDREIQDDLLGVDLCLKMLTKGYRNIYLPHVTLRYWRTPSDIDSVTTVEISPLESDSFRSKWQNFIDRDPCHNSNLAIKNNCYIIKS